MKNLLNKLRSVDKGTICRTVLLVLGWINQLVALIGYTTYASALWYQILSVVVTIVISLVTYWYNNDWSNTALLVRDVFDMLKDGKITKEEVEEFLSKHEKKEGTK